MARRSGKVTQQSTVQYQGHEGVEILIADPKGFRRSRLFFVNDALIEFGVIWENTSEPVAERDRYWGSIQFTP